MPFVTANNGFPRSIMTHSRQTGRQAFFRVIGSSSARIEERPTDGDVFEVEVFREPLLAKGLLGVLGTSLRDEVVVGLITCGGVLLSGGPSSSAEVRVVVIHDIKEVEGVRQQEVQEDKSGEEIGDEVNGEVEEEITQRAHETWRRRWNEQGTNLSHSVCTTIKEDSQRTTTLTDNKKRLRKRRIHNA